jgi:hypothetical protein
MKYTRPENKTTCVRISFNIQNILLPKVYFTTFVKMQVVAYWLRYYATSL